MVRSYFIIYLAQESSELSPVARTICHRNTVADIRAPYRQAVHGTSVAVGLGYFVPILILIPVMPVPSRRVSCILS